jgi:hypothetical protein
MHCICWSGHLLLLISVDAMDDQIICNFANDTGRSEGEQRRISGDDLKDIAAAVKWLSVRAIALFDFSNHLGC